MKTKLNRRNRIAARAVVLRAVRELHRQMVHFWVQHGRTKREASRLARTDAKVCARVYVDMYCR